MQKNTSLSVKLFTCCLLVFFLLTCGETALGWEDVGNRYGIDTSHPPYTDQNPFCDTYCGQCTAFAWGRALDRLGISIAFSVSSGRNACNWANIVTNIDDTLHAGPRKNSIAVWNGENEGCTSTNPGHVAYVEEVDGNDLYINEANTFPTHSSTDYGGGYNGFTKRMLTTEMDTRSGMGDLLGYLYLDSPFSDYYYWDFDDQGTEDWNARESLNQGLAFGDYWQIGSSFGDNASKRGIVSPELNEIHTTDYDTIQIKIGINSRFLEHPEVYFKTSGQWTPTSQTMHWYSGPGEAGTQNTYRAQIDLEGQIEQVRIDFDIGSDTQDVRIYIDRIEFLESADEFYILSGTATDLNGVANSFRVYAQETTGANLGNNVYTSDGTYEMALFPGNYDVFAYALAYPAIGGYYQIKTDAQNIEITSNSTLNIQVPVQAFYHITGYVTDTSEYGIDNVTVSAYEYSGRCYSRHTTNSLGYYDLTVIPGTYTISFLPAAGSGYDGVDLNDLVVSSNVTQPVSLASVTLYPLDVTLTDTLGNSLPGYIYANETSGAWYESAYTWTGSHGFSLPAGEYTVFSQMYHQYSTGYTYIRPPYQTTIVPNNNSLSIIEPAYQFVSLFGQVTNTEAIIQPNVWVSASDFTGICYGGSATDSGGNYSLSLIPGEYQLTITAPPATYPPFQIRRAVITSDTERNIRLSLDYSLIEEALSELDPGLDVALDVFDIIDQAETRNYDITVQGVKQVLQIVLNWAGSEMRATIYEPDGSLYGTYQDTSPPIVIEILDPSEGVWRCEVTAVDVPFDNYPFAVAVGITPNVAPVADAGGPYSGAVGSDVTLDASGSYDTDGSIVTYEWDWNNDGMYDDSTTSPLITHVWNSEYVGLIALKITDSGGLTDTDTADVEIQGEPETIWGAASTIGAENGPASRKLNYAFLLLAPVCAVLFLRLRKRV